MEKPRLSQWLFNPLFFLGTLVIFCMFNTSHAIAGHIEELDEFVDDSDALPPIPQEFTPFDNCTANALNRSVPTSRFGAFTLPNVPADEGLFRIRITCTKDGQTLQGQTELLSPLANSTTSVGPITLGVVEPIADSLTLTTSKDTLPSSGDTAQFTVTAVFDNGTQADITSAPDTVYTTSNPNIAQVTSIGLVIAQNPGIAILSASKDGVISTILITVTGGVGGDTDGDGMPDSFETANGLNPNDPTDAGQDLDGDGLTNLQEFQFSTNPKLADTDGDGLNDGAEFTRGTNPLASDTDGDGLRDGDEVTRGTNPLKSDTDGDGLSDGLEVRLGLNPLSLDSDRDGISDGLEDTDGNGLSNLDELGLSTDPGNPDTDRDDTPDGKEIILGCNPIIPEVTELTGRAIDGLGIPIQAADIHILGKRGKTDNQGIFTMPNIPSCPPRLIRYRASIYMKGIRLQGLSSSVFPLLGGATNIGDLIFLISNASRYPGKKFPVGSAPQSVASSDLDSDGIPDLVTANLFSNDVSVLLGNGDGSFKTEQRFTVGSRPSSVAVADINLDGILDIITANDGSFDVSVLLGIGNGTFLPQIRSSVGLTQDQWQ